jgi:archaellum component FlaF (FlaF/FlaG flagellin family)
MIGKELIAAILIIAFLVSIALAASASPLRAQNEQTAQSQPSSQVQHHILGVISDLTSDQKSFKLQLKSGRQITVEISQGTILLQYNPNQKTQSYQDLKKGTRVAVATTKTANAGKIQTKLIVLLPNREGYRIAHGVVTDLTDNALTIVLPGNSTQKVLLSKDTVYSKKNHRNPTIASAKDLAQGAQVVIVGNLEENVIIAKLVHIIKI